MKTLLLLIFMSFSGLLQAGCFYDHVKEARDLNHERIKTYKELLPGAEKPLKSLIFLEKLLLPMAKFYDHKFKKWENQGIDLLCSSIPKMSTVGPVQSVFRGHLSYDSLGVPDIKKVKKELKKSLKRPGLEGYLSQAKKILKSYQRAPRFHCLVRHFIESTIQISSLAGAEAEGLDPINQNKFLKDVKGLIRFHLFGLKWASLIDKKGIPFQESGLSVVCSELPEILK